MFRSKNARGQMVFVFLSLFAVMIAGQVAGRRVNAWKVFNFNEPHFTEVDFTAILLTNQIDATLTNKSNFEITTGTGFILVMQTDTNKDEWRVFPFRDDVDFDKTAEILPPEHSTVFILTEEMLSSKFIPGDYRIVTEIWSEETGIIQVWAPFNLRER